MSGTIVILGAAGRVSEAVATAYLKAGWRVRGVARGEKANSLIAGVEPVMADAYDGEALSEACNGADIIFHGLNPRYDEWETTVLPLAMNVLAAAKATGATVMIPGNVYNFGHSLGIGMTEETPFAPRENKGELRSRMEALFRDAARDGVKTIIIRAGDFYGGKRPETWLDIMILKDLRKNIFRWPGAWDAVHSFAYLPDLAEAFRMAGEKRAELSGFNTLHFAGHSVTGEQFHEAASRVTGRRLKKGTMPWGMIRILGVFNPLMREVMKMRYLWDVPHSMDNSRLAGLIGAEPHTPLDEALGTAIANLSLDANDHAKAA